MFNVMSQTRLASVRPPPPLLLSDETGSHLTFLTHSSVRRRLLINYQFASVNTGAHSNVNHINTHTLTRRGWRMRSPLPDSVSGLYSPGPCFRLFTSCARIALLRGQFFVRSSIHSFWRHYVLRSAIARGQRRPSSWATDRPKAETANSATRFGAPTITHARATPIIWSRENHATAKGEPT